MSPIFYPVTKPLTMGQRYLYKTIDLCSNAVTRLFIRYPNFEILALWTIYFFYLQLHNLWLLFLQILFLPCYLIVQIISFIKNPRQTIEAVTYLCNLFRAWIWYHFFRSPPITRMKPATSGVLNTFYLYDQIVTWHLKRYYSPPTIPTIADIIDFMKYCAFQVFLAIFLLYYWLLAQLSKLFGWPPACPSHYLPEALYISGSASYSPVTYSTPSPTLETLWLTPTYPTHYLPEAPYIPGPPTYFPGM